MTDGPRQWRITVGAGGSISAFALPAPSVGPVVRIGWLATPAFLVGVDADYRPTQRVHHGGGRADLQAVELSLRLCARTAELGSIDLFACAGGGAGQIRVVASGYTAGQPLTRPLFNTLAEALLRARLGEVVRLDASAGLRVPLQRDTFYVEDAGGTRTTLARSGPVYAQGSPGASVEF